MAFVLKTYTVVSQLPVVVSDGGTNVSYAPGQTFIESSGNLSVQRLLSLGYLVEAGLPGTPNPGSSAPGLIGLAGQALTFVLAAGDLALVDQKISFELTSGGDKINLHTSAWSSPGEYDGLDAIAGFRIDRGSDGAVVIGLGIDALGYSALALPIGNYIYWTDSDDLGGNYAASIYSSDGGTPGNLGLDCTEFTINELVSLPYAAGNVRLRMDNGVWDFGPGVLVLGSAISAVAANRASIEYSTWALDWQLSDTAKGFLFKQGTNNVAQLGWGIASESLLTLPATASIVWLNGALGATDDVAASIYTAAVATDGQLFIEGRVLEFQTYDAVPSTTSTGVMRMSGTTIDVGPNTLAFGTLIGTPLTQVKNKNIAIDWWDPYTGDGLLFTFSDGGKLAVSSSTLYPGIHFPALGYITFSQTADPEGVTVGAINCNAGGDLAIEFNVLYLLEQDTIPATTAVARVKIDGGVVDIGPSTLAFGSVIGATVDTVKHAAWTGRNFGDALGLDVRANGLDVLAIGTDAAIGGTNAFVAMPVNSYIGWTGSADTGTSIVASMGYYDAAGEPDNSWYVDAPILAFFEDGTERARISGGVLDLLNGTLLHAAGLPVPVVLAVVSVDLAATGTANLYTVPSGKSVIVVDVVVKPTTATAVTTFAVAGVGVAAGEDDIIASQELTGLDATTERFKFESSGQARVGAATEVIKFGVDTAATATALVADVYLIGYLI